MLCLRIHYVGRRCESCRERGGGGGGFPRTSLNGHPSTFTSLGQRRVAKVAHFPDGIATISPFHTDR